MDTPAGSEEKNKPASSVSADSRRSFAAKSIAIVLGAAAYAVPVVAGLVALLNPLRQKGAGREYLRLAALDALPVDGAAQKFPVITQRVDAWTRSIEPIGAVYLRRTGEKLVQALQVVCPHAGCTVENKLVTDATTGETAMGFSCPCHKASFDITGKRLEQDSQSPRDLDTLEVEIRNGTEVWVQFQNFKLGTPDKASV